MATIDRYGASFAAHKAVLKLIEDKLVAHRRKVRGFTELVTLGERTGAKRARATALGKKTYYAREVEKLLAHRESVGVVFLQFQRIESARLRATDARRGGSRGR